jgi:NAD(P)-dependent dehydrogenase (short-subunit alcohol dehydrogenase family)
MKKIVVVGGSRGFGRCIGVGLARRGAHVALLARRRARLVEAAEEAGSGALAIVCDVTDESSCRAAVEEAAAGLGAIDGLVYATGIGPLRRIADLDRETWRRAFDTNVIGASLMTACAINHLTASGGVAVYLSSVSASLTPPWPGLGAYIVSKAALDKLVEAWRAEHPNVGFTRLIVGECGGGEGESRSQFTAEWDERLATELFPIWIEHKYFSGFLIEIEEVVRVVEVVLRCGASASIPSVTVTPRPRTGGHGVGG